MGYLIEVSSHIDFDALVAVIVDAVFGSAVMVVETVLMTMKGEEDVVGVVEWIVCVKL